MSRRVEKGVKRGRSLEIELDGEKLLAYEGETIASALFAAGKRTFCKTNINKEPRGLYCGIGVCMGCRMIVNGQPNTLVCQTLVSPNCRVQTQVGLENWGALK